MLRQEFQKYFSDIFLEGTKHEGTFRSHWLQCLGTTLVTVGHAFMRKTLVWRSSPFWSHCCHDFGQVLIFLSNIFLISKIMQLYYIISQNLPNILQSFMSLAPTLFPLISSEDRVFNELRKIQKEFFQHQTLYSSTLLLPDPQNNEEVWIVAIPCT